VGLVKPVAGLLLESLCFCKSIQNLLHKNMPLSAQQIPTTMDSIQFRL
jgi:hypothetical protein